MSKSEQRRLAHQDKAQEICVYCRIPRSCYDLMPEPSFWYRHPKDTTQCIHVWVKEPAICEAQGEGE